jgi:Cof subfamily protein (haloacid dehalogenase superfamily)
MGGMFTLATGRSYLEARKYIEELDLQFPVILCNGAMIYKPATGELQPVATIGNKDLATILMDLEQKMPSSIDIFAYGVDKVYGTRIGPLSQCGMDGDFPLQLLPSFRSLPENMACLKVIAVANKNDMPQLLGWSKTMGHLSVEFVLSSDHYFEILPAGVSKGNALKTVLKSLHLFPNQAAAIGDHLNDLSMFHNVGLSAAVANAHPLALQHAKINVPSNNDHGVSYLIRHYLLPSLSQAHPY